MPNPPKIQDPIVERLADGSISTIRLLFGPHHFIELHASDNLVEFRMGTTHHGIRADASTVSSEFENFVSELRANHPDRAFD